MKPLNKIKSLIQYLPKRDIPIAEKFIKECRYDSLYELVDSAITKIERNKESENPKEEYNNIDLDELSDLRYEVQQYQLLLYPDTDYYEKEY